MRKDQSTLYDNERVSLEKLLNKRDPSHDKNLPIMPVTESSLNIFTWKNSLQNRIAVYEPLQCNYELPLI